MQTDQDYLGRKQLSQVVQCCHTVDTGVGDDEGEGNVKINKTDGHHAVLKVSQAYV